jgi:carbamoyltransferase
MDSMLGSCATHDQRYYGRDALWEPSDGRDDRWRRSRLTLKITGPRAEHASPMNILGISCFYHDSAACLLRGGRIVAAAEEERFSRRKHDPGFPEKAIRYCLDQAGMSAEDVDHVIFYEKPLRKLGRILTGMAATFPGSHPQFIEAMRAWLPEKLWIRRRYARSLRAKAMMLFGEHHLSHAASAFYPSPFDEAAVVTADGVGEWATGTIAVGRGLDLQIVKEIHYPHSLGLVYSAFTAYLGFEANEGEYKVMGLAAYGRPRYSDEIRRLVQVAQDGSFRVDLGHFEYHRGMRSFSRSFVSLFGPPRDPDAAIEERHADLAASIQQVTEEAVIALATEARRATGMRYLCMAGGVALNVLANSRVLREAGFDEVWVQPAAGDSGGALGAAMYLSHAVFREGRGAPMTSAQLGPGFDDGVIVAFLKGHHIAHRVLEPGALAGSVAQLLAQGQVIGWFQGRMEFGPRALGARSILADPTDPGMKERVNEKIKQREPFRPFAPAVISEAAGRYFDFGGGDPDRESPFMLFVAGVRPEYASRLPAVTHADGTARVQTVRRDQDPLFHGLIEEFGRLVGVPIVLNTSFNLRGEPIVRTPEEAFNSFSYTDMDALVMGTALIPAASKRRLAPYPGTARVATAEVLL